MIQMLRDKRIKERFKNEFGVNVDEWFDEAENLGSNINKTKK
jgi:hypothetical protein